MSLDALIFDVEMANRRLPHEPTDDSYDGDAMGESERDEWKAIRAHLPEILKILQGVRDERTAQKASKDA